MQDEITWFARKHAKRLELHTNTAAIQPSTTRKTSDDLNDRSHLT